MTREELDRELERLHAASFGWALTCCRQDRDEAEDVLQTAYLRAIEGRARFNGHASTRTWFFGVVRNAAAERRRTRWVRGEALLRWVQRAPSPEPSPTPEGASNRAESCRRVREVLTRLSSRQREMLHLVFYQDLTIEQAAQVVHIPVGTARTHYERGKANLRRLLAEEDR